MKEKMTAKELESLIFDDDKPFHGTRENPTACAKFQRLYAAANALIKVVTPISMDVDAPDPSRSYSMIRMDIPSPLSASDLTALNNLSKMFEVADDVTVAIVGAKVRLSITIDNTWLAD